MFRRLFARRRTTSSPQKRMAARKLALEACESRQLMAGLPDPTYVTLVDAPKVATVQVNFDSAIDTFDAGLLTVKLGSTPSNTGDLSGEYYTYCADYTSIVGPGDTYSTKPQLVSATTSQGTYTVYHQREMAYLFNTYAADNPALSAEQHAGIQLAIWELEYDSGVPDFTDGIFRLTVNNDVDVVGYAEDYAAEAILNATLADDAIFLDSMAHQNTGGHQSVFAYHVGENLRPDQTATIGFWQNKNGQKLLNSLNGSSSSTALGNWLASSFPNMYGASAGVGNNLAGKSNAYVANVYLNKFKVKGQKLDAQVMAVAFACYATNSTLAGGTTASQYGFVVSPLGTGVATFNIGNNGAAFGVANNSVLSINQILQRTNDQAINGVLWDADGSGTFSAAEQAKRNQANTVFTGINETGDI